MMGDHIESVLNATMKRSLRELDEARKTGKPLSSPPNQGIGISSIAVNVKRDPEGLSDPQLQVNVVVGREIWLDSINRIVNKLSVHLENHSWQVFFPPPRWTWYTTDHPLMRLNFESETKYDFKGGLGSKGTELILPLSPKHLLYAQIGSPAKDVSELPCEASTLIKRCIAQNAFRWIVGDAPAKKAEWFMPRVVNLEQYNAEEASFERYHDEQSAAERELRNKKDPHPSEPEENLS
jgi:hypothetical protein